MQTYLRVYDIWYITFKYYQVSFNDHVYFNFQTTSHVSVIKDSVWSIHCLWYDEEQIIFDSWVQYSLFESWASAGIVDNFVVSKTPLVIL